MKILELNIHYFDKHAKERKELKLKPISDSPVALKLQIAKAITPLVRRIEYYYVVVAVRKADKSKAYRTVVPKTVIV